MQSIEPVNDDFIGYDNEVEAGAPLVIEDVQVKEEPIVVNELPRFDLDQYIGNYHGHLQTQRLLCIGKHCPPLAVEAYRAAVLSIKKTNDVDSYTFAIEGLANAAPDSPDAKLDVDWVEQTSKNVRLQSEKLEAELKSYKNNMIKESIRAGHEDLGKHYYSAGDLNSAFKAFSRMRDYCTTPQHMLDMSLNLILISIEQRNWGSVTSNVMKVRNYIRTDEDTNIHQPKLAVASGLAHLARSAYLDAARSFLAVPSAIGTTYRDVVTMNDIAVYGGLCALASMERETLKVEVLENKEFKNFLELEPHIRRAVTAFYAARYGECLSVLESYKNDYLLDIFLQHHVETIYERIRTKSIVQYFMPFNCVTLEKMASAFGSNEEAMEAELIRLIEKNQLKARIDTQNRLVTSKETQFRNTVHKNALDMAAEYEKMVRLRLLRMNIVRAGLDIKGPKGHGSNRGGPHTESGTILSGGSRRELRQLMS